MKYKRKRSGSIRELHGMYVWCYRLRQYLGQVRQYAASYDTVGEKLEQKHYSVLPLANLFASSFSSEILAP
jgi:predicted negative regulator of RcsB-dependent stress response